MPVIISSRSLIGFKELFPGEQQRPIEEYIDLLGQDLLQKTCGHFLSMFRINAIPSNEQLLQEFFTFNKLKFYNVPEYEYVLKRYNNLVLQAGKNAMTLIAVEPLLRLFMWLWQHPEVGKAEREASPLHMLDFFKLIMLFNTKVIRDMAFARHQAQTYLDPVRYHRELLSVSFPQNDFVNVDYMQLCVTQFYKLIELLTFLNEQEDFSLLNKKLLNEYYCNSKEEYLKSIGLAVILPFQRNDAGWSVINVPPGPNFERDCNFLEKLAVKWEDEVASDENDYLPLRSNPLQRLNRGEYRLIYDSFILKKVYNGLVFILSGLVNNDKTLFPGKSFLGEIRRRFSENRLLYSVLQNIYSELPFKFISGEEFHASGLPGEPDSYLRSGDDIFLFESKDFYIKGTVKTSFNFGLIEQELKKDRLGKAVEQLAKNTGRVFTKQLILDTDYQIENGKVYPVILVHDALYSCPGLNYWVNKWFQEELKKVKKQAGMQVLNLENVMPLTILEIDTLILYEPQFRNEEFNLKTLLTAYHNQVDLNRFTFASKMQAQQHAMQSSIPFAEFVTRYRYDHNIEPDISRLSEMMKSNGIN